jgi:hypothetical protein
MDNIIEGYIFGMNLQMNSVNPYGVPFSFNMVILKEHIGGFSDISALSASNTASPDTSVIAKNAQPSLNLSNLDVSHLKQAISGAGGSPVQDVLPSSLPSFA